MTQDRKRSLAWSKEVERRARDIYKVLWPTAQRTKEHGRELSGSTDIVNTPFHVQVKARASTWVGSEFRKAKSVSDRYGATCHLVTQDRYGEPLVTMRLVDFIEEIQYEKAGIADTRPLVGQDEGELTTGG